ncbi:hypothetical protein [Nocardia carnea]|uniref:Uncharacterized protein n=1 Tax=Nocardia carnea TaxID=37328 RepID=A0ABW7U1A7_9NOCA|nr:hypothetical protein [Nocardia carnea]
MPDQVGDDVCLETSDQWACRRYMTDMTGEFSDQVAAVAATGAETESMTPEQLMAAAYRSEFTDVPLDIALAPDTDADRKPEMRPRRVAMPGELDVRCQIRASDLQLSRSA